MKYENEENRDQKKNVENMSVPVWKDADWRREAPKKILLAFLYLIGPVSYFFANAYNDYRFAEIKPLIFKFPIDDLIPFTRIAIVPYVYWYLYIFGTLLILFFIRDSTCYKKFMYSMVMGAVVCCTLFVIFPTHMIRPALQGNDILIRILQTIYNNDPPYNLFPSMHVVYAFTCFWYLLISKKSTPWFHFINILSFVTITISTVFTKQHYTPDILGGIAAGLVVCAAVTFSNAGGKYRLPDRSRN